MSHYATSLRLSARQWLLARVLAGSCLALNALCAYAITPATVGNVIQVATGGAVRTTRSVAMDKSGDFVVVWVAPATAPNSTAVFAQRYDATGLPQGPAISVFASALVAQAPAVAMDDNGNFAVVWQGNTGILVQLYSNSGAAQGSAITVNNSMAVQQQPSIAMDGVGDFVVAWEGELTSPGAVQVFAQRFNAAGTAQGATLNVSQLAGPAGPAGSHRASVATDGSGNFIVAWQTQPSSTFAFGIFAQRYDASGNALGSCITVSSLPNDSAVNPAIAVDPAGDFVVVWQQHVSIITSNPEPIFAQLYSVSGTPQGSPITVDGNLGPSSNPSVAMDSSGNFLVAWQTADLSSNDALNLQAYGADGNAQGSPFSSPSDGGGTSVAMDGQGDAAVAWETSSALNAQQYTLNGFSTQPPPGGGGYGGGGGGATGLLSLLMLGLALLGSVNRRRAHLIRVRALPYRLP